MRLQELARVIRSKNAGPYHITFDIIFEEPAHYSAFMESRVLGPDWFARTYGVPEESVAVIPYPPASALKVTMPRVASSGGPEDRDVYGAQQHGPLLRLDVPDSAIR